MVRDLSVSAYNGALQPLTEATYTTGGPNPAQGIWGLGCIVGTQRIYNYDPAGDAQHLLQHAPAHPSQLGPAVPRNLLRLPLAVAAASVASAVASSVATPSDRLRRRRRCHRRRRLRHTAAARAASLAAAAALADQHVLGRTSDEPPP